MAKLTATYQVTIPVKVREALGLVPGAEVDIEKQANKYVLVVEPLDMIRKKWRGRFKGRSTTMEYLDEVRGKVN